MYINSKKKQDVKSPQNHVFLQNCRQWGHFEQISMFAVRRLACMIETVLSYVKANVLASGSITCRVKPMTI